MSKYRLTRERRGENWLYEFQRKYLVGWSTFIVRRLRDKDDQSVIEEFERHIAYLKSTRTIVLKETQL